MIEPTRLRTFPCVEPAVMRQPSQPSAPGQSLIVGVPCFGMFLARVMWLSCLHTKGSYKFCNFTFALIIQCSSLFPTACVPPVHLSYQRFSVLCQPCLVHLVLKFVPSVFLFHIVPDRFWERNEKVHILHDCSVG